MCPGPIPGLLAAGGGTIGTVGSIPSLRGAVAGSAYVAAKPGLIGLTRSTAICWPAGADSANVTGAVPGSDGGWSAT